MVLNKLQELSTLNCHSFSSTLASQPPLLTLLSFFTPLEVSKFSFSYMLMILLLQVHILMSSLPLSLGCNKNFLLKIWGPLTTSLPFRFLTHQMVFIFVKQNMLLTFSPELTWQMPSLPKHPVPQALNYPDLMVKCYTTIQPIEAWLGSPILYPHSA
jgi:hypothetical protein